VGLLAANDGPRHLAGVSPAVTSNRGGVRSELARVDGSTRQGHQRIARARAHLGGPTGGAGVAGAVLRAAMGQAKGTKGLPSLARIQGRLRLVAGRSVAAAAASWTAAGVRPGPARR